MSPHRDLLRLQRALHPLALPPAGPAWNRDELVDLLPADAVMKPAAVLVGLVDRDDGPHVVLTRRTDSLRQHAGQVSFPGGRVEPGDAGVLEAALREAEEEIGLPRALVEPMGWLDPLATVSGYRVMALVAQIRPGFVPRTDPGEVAEVFEVPLQFLLEPGNLTRIAIEYAGRARDVLEFEPYAGVPGQRIWGATASILFNFRQRLERL